MGQVLCKHSESPFVSQIFVGPFIDDFGILLNFFTFGLSAPFSIGENFECRMSETWTSDVDALMFQWDWTN